MGMSPWPVMKMIGRSISTAASSRCRSSPLRPGSRTSSTRQAGTSGRWLVRNSRADAKVATLRPTERRRLWSASRIAASSSITKTMACVLVMLLPLIGGQGEVKGGAVVAIRYRPEPPAVRLDDGAADREPHAHPIRLGRVKGLEEPLPTLRVQSNTAVLHGHQYRARVVGLGADH